VEDIPNAYVQGGGCPVSTRNTRQRPSAATRLDTAGHTVDTRWTGPFRLYSRDVLKDNTFEAKAKPMINECLSGSLG